MKLWRIAKQEWALDKTGEGMRLHGGRFNPKGVAALYAAMTIELCALEKFVHLPTRRPPPLVLVELDLPDDADLFYEPMWEELPRDWADEPVSSGSQDFGAAWLQSSRQLAMLVPSVIVPEARNAVLNPVHPAMARVTMRVVRPFHFDARLFKARK